MAAGKGLVEDSLAEQDKGAGFGGAFFLGAANAFFSRRDGIFARLASGRRLCGGNRGGTIRWRWIILGSGRRRSEQAKPSRCGRGEELMQSVGHLLDSLQNLVKKEETVKIVLIGG